MKIIAILGEAMTPCNHRPEMVRTSARIVRQNKGPFHQNGEWVTLYIPAQPFGLDYLQRYRPGDMLMFQAKETAFEISTSGHLRRTLTVDGVIAYAEEATRKLLQITKF